MLCRFSTKCSPMSALMLAHLPVIASRQSRNCLVFFTTLAQHRWYCVSFIRTSSAFSVTPVIHLLQVTRPATVDLCLAYCDELALVESTALLFRSLVRQKEV